MGVVVDLNYGRFAAVCMRHEYEVPLLAGNNYVEPRFFVLCLKQYSKCNYGGEPGVRFGVSGSMSRIYRCQRYWTYLLAPDANPQN